MYEIPFWIEVTYNRHKDIEKDYKKTIVVMATSKEMAIKKINEYDVENLFDYVEDDYIEDSLYAN